AEPRDADLADRLELRLLERAGLALESDLGGVLPAQLLGQTIDERAELRRADVGWRPAAEIDEIHASTANRGRLPQGANLGAQGREIALDLAAVLVRVDLEVAELAALAAERDVDVEAELRPVAGRAMKSVLELWKVFGTPEGIRRIVRDEIVSDLRP